MTDAPAQFTAEEKHREALRELAMRKRLYPWWIEKGVMTAADAARKIAIMAAITEDYAQAAQQELLL
jgi:predicted deacetylase